MDLLYILQGLGSNEVSKKDASLTLLFNYLKNQSSIEEEGIIRRMQKYQQIWNCLFYYFWNTDKPTVQKTSAEFIAKLFVSVKDKDNFILACLDSFNAKWSKIDFLRLDKYIMLMDTIYNKFFSYCFENKKYKKVKKLFEGVRRLSTTNNILINFSSKTEYSTYAKYMNYSLFRNFSKNIGNNMESIAFDKLSLESLLKYFGILPKRESDIFQELTINKLYSILKNDHKKRVEYKEMLNLLLNKSKFTNSGLQTLKRLFNKLYVELDHKINISKNIPMLDLTDEDDCITEEKEMKYKVDPVNDSILQRNYFTKFRISNMDKMKKNLNHV